MAALSCRIETKTKIIQFTQQILNLALLTRRIEFGSTSNRELMSRMKARLKFYNKSLTLSKKQQFLKLKIK